MTRNWLDQSERQIQASHGRPIIWYFAEPLPAAYARGLFLAAGGGREAIQIAVLPWKEGAQ